MGSDHEVSLFLYDENCLIFRLIRFLCTSFRKIKHLGKHQGVSSHPKFLDVLFIVLINVKMPTLLAFFLTFMSIINSILS